MKTFDLKKLAKEMEKCQDKKRYAHTIGVQHTAACLAMRYGASLHDAQVAGLLHDCAKCIPDNKKLELCKRNKIEITGIEQKSPYLLHSKLGGFLAKEKYHVNNEDIVNAIINHTTGRPGMSLLEKIIFIADYIEPGRKTAPDLDEVRRLAFEDLDLALCRILKDTLEYLNASGKQIDEATQKTYEYYQTQVQAGKRRKQD